MGGRSELEFQPARKVDPVQRRLADVEKARRLIGFEAAIPLDDGLERLVAWWKSQ
jgi:UDP-glucose 4-epimerase